MTCEEVRKVVVEVTRDNASRSQKIGVESHVDKCPACVKWIQDEARVPDAVTMLDRLTPDERLDVFNCFCTVCGSDDPECNCWNDE